MADQLKMRRQVALINEAIQLPMSARECPTCRGTGALSEFDRKELGRFMRRQRLDAKLPLRLVASRMNISIGYLSDIEQGRKSVPEGRLVAWASAVAQDLPD